MHSGSEQNQAYVLSGLIPHAGPQPQSQVASRKHVPRATFTSTLMTPGPRPRGLHACCPGLAFEATYPQFSAHSQHPSLQLPPRQHGPLISPAFPAQTLFYIRGFFSNCHMLNFLQHTFCDPIAACHPPVGRWECWASSQDPMVLSAALRSGLSCQAPGRRPPSCKEY